MPPNLYLFNFQRSFTTQVQALCMLQMLVWVREMPIDSYTIVFTHLSGRFTNKYPIFAYFE